MLRFRIGHALLYAAGFGLIALGNRDVWERKLEDSRRKELDRRLAKENELISSKPFQVQELVYDPATQKWTNPHHYLQTINLGRLNPKTLRQRGARSSVETNDDENASDTF